MKIEVLLIILLLFISLFVSSCYSNEPERVLPGVYENELSLSKNPYPTTETGSLYKYGNNLIIAGKEESQLGIIDETTGNFEVTKTIQYNPVVYTVKGTRFTSVHDTAFVSDNTLRFYNDHVMRDDTGDIIVYFDKTAGFQEIWPVDLDNNKKIDVFLVLDTNPYLFSDSKSKAFDKEGKIIWTATDTIFDPNDDSIPSPKYVLIQRKIYADYDKARIITQDNKIITQKVENKEDYDKFNPIFLARNLVEYPKDNEKDSYMYSETDQDLFKIIIKDLYTDQDIDELIGGDSSEFFGVTDATFADLKNGETFFAILGSYAYQGNRLVGFEYGYSFFVIFNDGKELVYKEISDNACFSIEAITVNNHEDILIGCNDKIYRYAVT